MKKNYKKIAFTIAEILIALGISAVIAVIFFKNVTTAYRHYQNSLGAYSALKNLETAVYDLAQSVGCSAYDTTADISTLPIRPYCYSATAGQASKYLPWYLRTSESVSRGLCYRLANEEFNTVFSACNSTATSNFNSATPAFTTSNGMRFFFASAAASSIDINGVWTIYIDIDGLSKRRGSVTESANGKKDADVIKFLVSIDGNTVVPDPAGIAANNNDYISASAWYNDGTKDVYVASGVSFRAAACAAQTNPFPSVDTAYCTSDHSSSYAAISQASSCTTASGHTCTFDYAKPKMLGNFGR